MRGVEGDVTRGRLSHQALPRSRYSHVAIGTAEEEMTMQARCHWLTELAEVYARHAIRHGPNRLLPAEVLPAHGWVPKDANPSPQGGGPDGRTAEHSTKACTRHRPTP
jgi:hypothetical protein